MSMIVLSMKRNWNLNRIWSVLTQESLLWEGDQDLPRGRFSLGSAPDNFHNVVKLRLLPKFYKDPEMLFSLVEHVADTRSWPDSDRTLNVAVC